MKKFQSALNQSLEESGNLPLCSRDAARLKEGRGSGSGADYRPFITVYDATGRGKVTRLMGNKTRREHHLLSEYEAAYFFILDWSPAVEDVREGYPIPLEDSKPIAKEKGFRHPQIRKELCLLTIDFLITVRDKDGKQNLVARTIKPTEDLANPRVLEKLEIEQAWCENRGIDWGIVTQNEIHFVYSANVEKLRLHVNLTELGLTHSDVEHARGFMEPNWENYSTLAEITKACDGALAIPSGQSLAIAFHLIASGQWSFDLKKELNPRTLDICREIDVSPESHDIR